MRGVIFTHTFSGGKSRKKLYYYQAECGKKENGRRNRIQFFLSKYGNAVAKALAEKERIEYCKSKMNFFYRKKT
jgi:hypothetical protein